MNDTELDTAFLGKASLATLLGGIAIWGLGLVTGHVDMACIILLISIALAFGLGFRSRRDPVGRIAMYLSGALAVLGIVNYIVFVGLDPNAEQDLTQQDQALQNQEIQTAWATPDR